MIYSTEFMSNTADYKSVLFLFPYSQKKKVGNALCNCTKLILRSVMETEKS